MRRRPTKDPEAAVARLTAAAEAKGLIAYGGFNYRGSIAGDIFAVLIDRENRGHSRAQWERFAGDEYLKRRAMEADMATVDHALPENPTAAEIKQYIKTYVDAKWTTIEAELHEAKAGIADAIADATADSVKVGDQIALQMSAGQVLCADEGGPTVPDKVVEFQSRNPDAIGPHELFTVLKP